MKEMTSWHVKQTHYVVLNFLCQFCDIKVYSINLAEWSMEMNQRPHCLFCLPRFYRATPNRCDIAASQVAQVASSNWTLKACQQPNTTSSTGHQSNSLTHQPLCGVTPTDETCLLHNMTDHLGKWQKSIRYCGADWFWSWLWTGQVKRYRGR